MAPDMNSVTNIAVPSIVASSTSTVWYDVTGPPKTLSKTGYALDAHAVLQSDS